MSEPVAHPGEIAATPDGDGMRVVWSGDSTAQVYLQTTNPEGSLDLTPYVDGGGALVFDARLNAEPGEGAAMPAPANSSCLWSSVVRRNGGASGLKKRTGCGSKVAMIARRPSCAARATARWTTAWWPR